MIRIQSENELLDSFRLIDRDQVELPVDMRFPLLVKNYLAWPEASGARVFLVFEDPSSRKPFGIVFRQEQASFGQAACMCEWCHSVRSGNGVGLLTATSNDSTRV